ncbi:hypothetical protein ACWD4V_13905 [Streptomyces tsukubensis]
MTTDPEADTLELPPVPTFGDGRPRWAAHRIHPRRIALGHRQLTRRLRTWTLAQNTPARITALVGGTLLALRAANTEPRLLATGAGAYLVAAWRASRPTPPTEDELKQHVIEGVLEVMGDRPAVFVREVYDTLRARPAAAHLDDARLRTVLLHCGITIHRSVRISTAETGRSGIKRTDLDTLLSPNRADQTATAVDTGQRPSSEAVEHP